MKTRTSTGLLASWIRGSIIACVALGNAYGLLRAAETTAEVKNLSIDGSLEAGKARLVIETLLGPAAQDKQKLLYSTSIEHSIRITPDLWTHNFAARFEILQGEAGELTLAIAGEGEVRKVEGEALEDWSLRQGPTGSRMLVLRPRKAIPPLTNLVVRIEAETKASPKRIQAFTLTPPHPALFQGYVTVQSSPELAVQAAPTTGLIALAVPSAPESLRRELLAGQAEPLLYRFYGSEYTLALEATPADPEARRVVLRDCKLTGVFTNQTAAFTLTGTAQVKNARGGSLLLLSGDVALTGFESDPHSRLLYEQNHFMLKFDRAGEFPIRVQFNAAIQQSDSGRTVSFHVAPSTLQPILVKGLAATASVQFAGAARPERSGSDFLSFLPPTGEVRLSWRDVPPEAEGKLFYSAEMLAQIHLSPGVMGQAALLNFKIMQGELNRVVLLLRGGAEVTRVQGSKVVGWTVETPQGNADRRLVVQLNEPQKDQFAIQVSLQTPLGAFPQAVDATGVRPEGATQFAGYWRVVNEGAVRLEVVQATGLSQISPEQFPESDVTKSFFRPAGGQRFAYRFSGADFALRIQADQILPELSVSEVLSYRLGENEQSLEAEIELEIRDAPLRELVVLIPRGFAVARLTVPGLADYYVRDLPDPTTSELRLVYTQPVTGRQVFQARLERTQPLGATNWVLPSLKVAQAKAIRGYIAVSAETGFRLAPERAVGLSEIATAFFPRKVAGMQLAYRLSDPGWQASVRVERLPQTVQADALHLFSIGEGIAYGSTIINYLVSGAPVSAFALELSSESLNVEFTGKDIRNWQKTTNGYLVQLHTPVSGAYTLLATYERPFRPQGETLAFTGARPLDAQPEQGYVLVVSGYQFQGQPAEVSPGLLSLEAGEVPAEYRLFFDAPILAAYRYTSRPFTLRLNLSPIAQGESLSQVVDRAALQTRISKAGQVLTDIQYFVKNRGQPHFRVTVPLGTQLWSALVNGLPVVPVTDGRDNLIPLPQQPDPNAVVTVTLQLASPTNAPSGMTIAAPVVAAPVLLAQWKIEPDTGQRLIYQGGSLTPVLGPAEVTGFAELGRMLSGGERIQAWTSLLAVLALVSLSVLVWRWTTQPEVFRFSARHVMGLVVGTVSLLLALGVLWNLAVLAQHQATTEPRNLTFLAPVQQGSNPLIVQVGTVDLRLSWLAALGYAWPALLALLLWLFTAISGRARALGGFLGWMLLVWASLRWPHGVPFFLGVTMFFLTVKVVLPAVRRLARLPRQPVATTPETVAAASSSTALLALAAGLLALAAPGSVRAEEGISGSPGSATSDLPMTQSASTNLVKPALAELVTHQVRVEGAFVLGTVTMRWRAQTGERLTLLSEPAVLTEVSFPEQSVKLITTSSQGKRSHQLIAQSNEVVEVRAQYQLEVASKDKESGFVLPTPHGLINVLDLTLANLDVDIVAPGAVSVERKSGVSTNTSARLILSPKDDAWIGWKPRSRDLKNEKPVFYAELSQLYVPSPGVVEGVHYLSVRPAQGELRELMLNVPPGSTITDVVEPARISAEGDRGPGASPPAALVTLWRFDPDLRQLRVMLRTPQSKPFTLIVRSQATTGPLPYEQSVGLLSVAGASGQIGLLGFATGNEVQLESVSAEAFSTLNLEDFPASVLQPLQDRVPGLTLRRAFRYANLGAAAVLRVSAVQPDVRVETQTTLSLGEDRTLLAANATVAITRAGIFRLSFALPPGMDVESISGDSLSHWTEQKLAAERVITLHLKGKTDGQHQFAISLAGAGVQPGKAWAVPQLVFREAAKDQGTLMIVPEQGMRLQVAVRQGVSQLDPQKSGVKQKGVLGFRIQQAPWKLAVDIEQVDAWVQVTTLQHAQVNEALIKVTGNLHYQIENTGLKSFRVLLPAAAESVRFQGDQIADFRIQTGARTNGLQAWEIKLHRRVLGPYLLQVSYQLPMPEQARQTSLRGFQPADVNTARGFVTVQSGGRLQLRVDAVPSALQPIEWQSIPKSVQQDLPSQSAHFTYRLVEPVFELDLKIDRHPAAKLLPARVTHVGFTSVIADNGVMLTQVRLELIPGDKRLLYLTLPKEARFWFAFVNQTGVWPLREQDRILIPLELQSHAGKPIAVEFFYSGQIGKASPRALDLELWAPKFDLPLEDVTWRVFLNEKWQVRHSTGSLQLADEQIATAPGTAGLEYYLQNEASAQREKTKEAEQMIAAGNTALEQGNPQQARRAFQAAFGLSQGDNAFNEDARVQLNNLKLQQALVGLNFRQATVAGDSETVAGKLRELRGRKDLNYTQQDAKSIIERHSPDENSAFMRLAQRLIQQQEAALNTPASIHASIPEQGRVLTFKRAIVVNTQADLRIKLDARATGLTPLYLRVTMLLATAMILGAFGLYARASFPQPLDGR